MKRLLAAVVLVAASVSGCTSGSADGTFRLVSPGGNTEFSYGAGDRQPIPELAGPALVGTGTVSTSQFKGQVVVLNFWGSWCGDCRVEASDLQAASVSLEPKGVQFLGIDVRDGQTAGAGYVQAKQITYPSIFDSGMRTLLALRGYPSSAIPSTIVLDRSGAVAHIWLGRVTQDQLVDTVGAIASEK